jgi:mannose-1-phosphate guanylyltransferase
MNVFESMPAENIYVVTNENYTDLVKEQLPAYGRSADTDRAGNAQYSPCVAYGCFKIESLNPDAAIVVAPSDHLILDEDAFVSAH